jgi:flagellar assembly protein FliH
MKSSYNRIIREDEAGNVRPFIPTEVGTPKPVETASDQAEEAVIPEEPDPSDLVLEKARQEAARILEQANEDARKIREQARNDGFAEGRSRGRREGMDDVLALNREQQKKMIDDVQKVLDLVSKERSDMLRHYAGELRDLAVSIAEKVIHISLSSSGEIIERMITQEAQEHRKTEWVKIYIDRKDYDLMVQADRDVIDELQNLSEHIRFVVADNQPQGYLIMETPEEIVDMSVETQIANIREGLKGMPLDQDVAQSGGEEADV